MREEKWGWGNSEWKRLWWAGECTRQLVVTLLKCSSFTPSSDVFFRNVNKHVVSPLVSETLDRPNKKHLRDRCVFLVSDKWPLPSIYLCTSHHCLGVTGNLLDCIQGVPIFGAHDISSQQMATLTRESFPFYETSPSCHQNLPLPSFSSSIFLEMVSLPYIFLILPHEAWQAILKTASPSFLVEME